jgi:hypothetical protein
MSPVRNPIRFRQSRWKPFWLAVWMLIGLAMIAVAVGGCNAIGGLIGSTGAREDHFTAETNSYEPDPTRNTAEFPSIFRY